MQIRTARPSDDSPGRPSPVPGRRLLAASVAIAMVGVPAVLVAPAAIAAPEETATTAAAEPAVDAAPAAPYEAPVAEEPVTEEPVAEEPVTEPVTEEPVTEEPVAEEPAAEEPTAEEPAAEEPAVDEPAEEPVSGEQPAPVDPIELPEAEPGTLTLVTPTDGAEFDPAAAMFAGTGVTALDTIAITYEDADGDTTAATSALPVVVGTDLTWSAPVSFGELAEDQTEIEVTITELDGELAVVGAPITVSITIVEVAAPAYPYTVTLPAEGSTVDTYTPVLTGTSAPGEAILATVTNPGDTVPVVVGATLADAAGVFSAALDLGKVVQDDDGETDVTIDVTRVGGDGTIVADALRSVDIVFAPGGEPFEPNAPGIILLPEQITVSDAKDPLKGVQVSATGFEQNEDVEVILTAPGGATIVFDEDALEALGGADETGTFEAPLFLFGDTPLGIYTVTVNGVDSDVSVTGSFELIADPAPVIPPTVPADNGTVTPISHTPADNGSSDKGGKKSWADDELAYTGSESAPLAGLAAFLLLAGAALVLFRRTSRRTLSI
ncbi:LPXTG cell wall anchor domain-containing protein [Planctomonas psychrotolerans]|uniref:LPXTG cell wall anchor domain-containing protein n=1 Tax=Planctomonas psychrotolerans TaxID=2528712 RepID=UPI0012388351|nr:LPXTG cell wall anchor domain-containing protein [Planctomonas psychrotolerans]